MKTQQTTKSSLSIGIQSFSKLRKMNAKYVDKTSMIQPLVEESRWNRLNRPRRSGKSLFMSTLKNYFQGNEEYFQGTSLENNTIEHPLPVLHVDLSSLPDPQQFSLESSLAEMLDRIAGNQDLKLESQSCKAKWIELIEKLSKREEKEVVVLIDEYDHLLTKLIHDPDQFSKAFRTLQDFFVALKSVDSQLHFVLFTGVMNNSDLFRGLNNMRDLTFVEKYASITGFTEEELDRYFKEETTELASKEGVSFEKIKDKLRKYFAGYSWDGKTFCYNSWDILNSFTNQKLSNYWCQTGQGSIFRGLIQKFSLTQDKLNGLQVPESQILSCDIKKVDPIPIFLQNGYLTVKKVEKEYFPYRYTLGIPNTEVQQDLFPDDVKTKI